ncbi:metal binding domain of Ada-domain-containing protein [Macrophomina phaseolina]|uniref:Metal binding domain of Ada-domain-containing protein n=1 Tax=Macrophomina phaseolina TaxID=35725 RepID=A0ABQ8GWW6_9PEZI|nr:metal binding domain of Ada-domain-containing protein [Macrophomina phaseolina]
MATMITDASSNASNTSAASYTTPLARWRALLARCPAAHSAFVYAVLTTRIYCRPTCAARLARRANVLFYDDARAAAAAGFRPCKRCAPDRPGGEREGEKRLRAARSARAVLEREAGNVVWRRVAEEVGMTPRYLHELFKGAFGVTPGAYAAAVRERTRRGEGESAGVAEVAAGDVLLRDEADGMQASSSSASSERGGVDMADVDVLLGLASSPSSSSEGFLVGEKDQWAVGEVELSPDTVGPYSWEDFVLWDAVTFPLDSALENGQEAVG